MEKDKDIIEIIADEPSDTVSEEQYTENTDIITNDEDFIHKQSRLAEYISHLPHDLSVPFIVVSAVICAAVIAAALAAGIYLPKSDSAVSKRLAALRDTDKTYIETNEINNTVIRETETLNSRLTEKQKELEEFNKSQDNLDKISESNDAMQKEKDTLRDEVRKKQSTLAGLESSVSSQTKKIITWSSGRYNVGRDIAPGTYTVTGTGSISIGNSGKSLANKNLKSDGETFTLNDGDVIQIDGNAKFVPQ